MKIALPLLLSFWLLNDSALAIERMDQREPCASRNPLRNPYFGDTHVHTAFSYDAWGQGTRNTPRDAYRFARGEAVGIQPFDENGRALRSVRLRRALDFAVVTDHAELLGPTTAFASTTSSWKRSSTTGSGPRMP